MLIQATRKPAKKNGFDLSEWEKDVLGLLAHGMNNSQIAEALVISVSTAKFHVSSILSKLNISSRTEVVSVVLKNNLVN